MKIDGMMLSYSNSLLLPPLALSLQVSWCFIQDLAALTNRPYLENINFSEQPPLSINAKNGYVKGWLIYKNLFKTGQCPIALRQKDLLSSIHDLKQMMRVLQAQSRKFLKRQKKPGSLVLNSFQSNRFLISRLLAPDSCWGSQLRFRSDPENCAIDSP